MGLATEMKKVTDDIRNSRQNLREAEKSRLNREDERQEEGEEQRKEREKFIMNCVIAPEKDRIKEAKQLLSERKRNVKHIFNEVNSFLGDVRDEMDETRRVWHTISGKAKHFSGNHSVKAKTTKSSKSKKKKRR